METLSSVCRGVGTSLKAGKGGEDIPFLRSTLRSLFFRTILAAVVALLLAAPQLEIVFLLPSWYMMEWGVCMCVYVWRLES